jgi:molybdopterin-guanine dinucleotide biosynthesis protein A
MIDFAAALIAGGRSTRMGTDKAFLEWHGRALWEHQMEKLRSLGPRQLLLSCRRDQPFPPQPDISPVYDEWPDSGPLGGVASCLRACRSPLLAVLGVDLPILPADFLRGLLTTGGPDGGVVTSRRSERGKIYEPLAAVYPVSMLGFAEQKIAAGRLSMQEFIRHGIERGGIKEIAAPGEAGEWFRNLNAPGDFGGNRNGGEGGA